MELMLMLLLGIASGFNLGHWWASFRSSREAFNERMKRLDGA